MDQAAFALQIRQALEHLHDFAYLQTLPLTQALSQGGQTLDQCVRQLRSALLDAIDQLMPDSTLPPMAKERRPYILLYGRYVQGLDTNELQEELAISLRQLRREQKRALQAVSNLLWNRLAPQLTDQPQLPEGRRAMAEAEVTQLINQAQLEDFDLTMVIDGVLAVLAPVARNHHTEIINQWPANLPPVRANRVILRQAIMNLLSYAIDYAVNGQVKITGRGQDEIQLQIKAVGQELSEMRAGVGLDISQKLIVGLGGRLEISETAIDPREAKLKQWKATISLPQAEDISILIVDDNVGLIDLFRRYLAGQPYRVLEAHAIEQILQLAGQTKPRLIVLDVMMPHQDGWEILQRLRATSETSDIPILICSVLNEPEIAKALGATDYLLKPVTQDALLAKVEQWCFQSHLPPPAEL